MMVKHKLNFELDLDEVEVNMLDDHTNELQITDDMYYF